MRCTVACKAKCNTCRVRAWRVVDPVRAAYTDLRTNAKRRNIGFYLTLGQFREFCVATKYMELKGNNAEDMTIDRIDWYKGYSVDNIQILTRRENSKKGRKGKRPEYKPDGCPF